MPANQPTALNISEVAPEQSNLLGMAPQQLREFMAALGEKPFRATQLLKWIHQRGVRNFDEMTDISKVLRAQLQEQCCIELPEILSEQVSDDGTRKWLLKVSGGSAVEMVLIPEGGRKTLCVSSQVGCSLDCSFCATGKQGFNRDLNAAEIIGQLWIAANSLRESGEEFQRAVTNVVFMGMGEPLLNFDNVLAATQLMLDDNCYGLSKRRVTVSTSGVVPGINKLAELSDVSLALSLHAGNDALRDVLVPVNKKYPLVSVLAACKNYLEQLPDNKRVITVEYTLIKDVNDSFEDAMQVAQVLKELPCKINLIPFNPFSASDYERPSRNAVMRFRDALTQQGYIVTVRTTRGDDIAAACGQLAGEVNDRTKRSARYQVLARSQ